MIGRIEGVLLEKMPPELLVDVNGVAYEIFASMSTIYELPSIGHKVVLHTHLQIKEDAHSLYGFVTKDERALFKILIKVNGIGPKMALSVLSSMTPTELIKNVQESQIDSLTKIPGVGKRTAERLVVELRDKLGHAAKQDLFTERSVVTQVQADPRQEAEAALIALGYKPQEASKAISRLPKDDSDSESLIRAALKGMLK